MAEAAISTHFLGRIPDFFSILARFLPNFDSFDPYPALYRVNSARILAGKRSAFLLEHDRAGWTVYLRHLGSPAPHRASQTISTGALRSWLAAVDK